MRTYQTFNKLFILNLISNKLKLQELFLFKRQLNWYLNWAESASRMVFKADFPFLQFSDFFNHDPENMKKSLRAREAKESYK